MTSNALRRQPTWAITSYFDSCGSGVRLANYKAFREQLEVPLVTVELSFDGSFALEPDDAEVLIQLSDGDVLWQKERLLNVALKASPGRLRRSRLGGLRPRVRTERLADSAPPPARGIRHGTALRDGVRPRTRFNAGRVAAENRARSRRARLFACRPTRCPTPIAFGSLAVGRRRRLPWGWHGPRTGDCLIATDFTTRASSAVVIARCFWRGWAGLMRRSRRCK